MRPTEKDIEFAIKTLEIPEETARRGYDVFVDLDMDFMPKYVSTYGECYRFSPIPSEEEIKNMAEEDGFRSFIPVENFPKDWENSKTTYIDTPGNRIRVQRQILEDFLSKDEPFEIKITEEQFKNMKKHIAELDPTSEDLGIMRLGNFFINLYSSDRIGSVFDVSLFKFGKDYDWAGHFEEDNGTIYELIPNDINLGKLYMSETYEEYIENIKEALMNEAERQVNLLEKKLGRTEEER